MPWIDVPRFLEGEPHNPAKCSTMPTLINTDHIASVTMTDSPQGSPLVPGRDVLRITFNNELPNAGETLIIANYDWLFDAMKTSRSVIFTQEGTIRERESLFDTQYRQHQRPSLPDAPPIDNPSPIQ